MDTKTKKKANTKKKTESSKKKEIETEIFEEEYRYQWKNRHQVKYYL